ncbi:MAG: sulfite exporter TauE/SafE family protein [bacterium]|nr:sulfite exporter TauE/SafE family protein [bacterium]
MTTQTKHSFHVVGMHCKSCVMLTENELGSHPEVHSVQASLKDSTVEVVGNFGAKERKHLAEEFSQLLAPHGYSLALERPVRDSKSKWRDFKIALPIAIGVMALFFTLQKLGIVNLVNTSSVSYGTAFIIGIIASLSTCMAVVGGLLLSMSATFAKEGDRVRPQLMFHAGRIISFFVLGGVIGVIGSSFVLNTSATFILGMIIGLVMLIMGINLLDIFHWSKKLTPGMPRFISKHALGLARLNHTLTPFLVGIATFFLPCGFTQAMQIYTLSTGGFIQGGLTMFAFALGTLPILALISFSSFSIQKSSKAGIFFKTAGMIVIMFALFNIINSLAAAGIITPLFNL